MASEEIWDLYVDRIVTVLAGPPPSTNESEGNESDPEAHSGRWTSE
ncbi:MAG: hypothetical protein ABSA65_11670 [Acidimicrobiales bacterium]